MKTNVNEDEEIKEKPFKMNLKLQCLNGLNAVNLQHVVTN